MTEKTTKKTKEESKASPKKLNAAQKLEALENLVLGFQQQFNILAEEIDRVGEVVQILGKRLNASNKVANIADESVNDVIIKEHVGGLEKLTKELVTKGVIKESENGEIKDEKCFVVAREVDKEGNEVAKRIQFAVMTLMPELKQYFIGQKKGSLVKNEHNENSIEIIEVYDVIPPKTDIVFEEASKTEEVPAI
jgi:hypothetical protein